MITNELLSFIRNEINIGKNKEQIKAELLSSGGWSTVDIEEAFQNIDGQVIIKDINPPKNNKFSKLWLIIIVFIIVIISFLYFFKNKKIDIISDISTEPVELSKNSNLSSLDLLSAIPPELKIISKEGGTILTEGNHKGLKFKIAIGKNLYPLGLCTGNSYYNPITKKSGEGWFSISAQEHSSGEFTSYSCIPEEKLGEYIIPLISYEHQDLYGENRGVDHYMMTQIAGLMAFTVKNNLYNQIYSLQNQEYSLLDLDKYGNIIESVFSRCDMPQYQGKNLLNIGPNSGGCSPLYWHDSAQSHSGTATIDPLLLDISVRYALLELLTNDGCGKGYVASYLEEISKNKEISSEEFIQKLSCAGTLTIVEEDVPLYSH